MKRSASAWLGLVVGIAVNFASSDRNDGFSIAICDIMPVKTIEYSQDALADLRRHRAEASRIMAKIARYAETGAGDVKVLTGVPGKRLRVGDFRVIFDENAARIRIIRIGPRGVVYD